MTHDEMESLLGAYALDALEADEAAALEAHLADCPRCRAEVAAHRETAALLGNVGGDAPVSVWEGIAAELGLEHGQTAVAPPPPSTVLPIPRRRRFATPVLAALAAVAAVVIVLLGVSTIHLQDRVDALHDAITAGSLQQAAAAALLDPRHSSVRLASSDGRLNAQVVIEPNGDAYLVNSDLPALDRLRTYQLWGLDRGVVVSLGLLGANPRYAAFRVDSAVSRLMVTAEPRGGRPQPDTPVLVQGNLRI
jgi:anti-sigma factor RsiW